MEIFEETKYSNMWSTVQFKLHPSSPFLTPAKLLYWGEEEGGGGGREISLQCKNAQACVVLILFSLLENKQTNKQPHESVIKAAMNKECCFLMNFDL